MKINFAIIFLLCTSVLSAQSYYGTPFGANSLSNLPIGKYPKQQVSYRFRASYTGSVTKILVFIATGDGYGVGGSLKLSLETDDGTSKHCPSGNILTSVFDPDPYGHWGEQWPAGAVALYTFDKPANLVAGALYHLRWTNLDPDPINNFVSANMLYSTSGTFDRISILNITDLAALRYYDYGGWIDEKEYTPLYTLFYSDGREQGQGYCYAGVNYPRKISGTYYKVRSKFTVSGENKIVKNVWARLKIISGNEDLKLRLEKSDGILIEEVSVSSLEFDTKMGWVSKAFLSNHILESGSSYQLILSTGSNTTYQTFWIQEGTEFFGHIRMFPDGQFQYTTDGSATWNEPSFYKASIFFETIIDNSPPLYLSSAIDYITPSLLKITYNVNLDADTIPSADAFKVQVNGVNRSINTITISSNTVRLTLASPVVFGDVISVAYIQPNTNRLQTPSGGLAVSMTSQQVTNNLLDPTTPNDPPVITLNYNESANSGFVYELDASGTTDPNNDVLTYTWTTPVNFTVSATDGSKIKFLAPPVSTSQDFNFLLNVNDGRVIVSKSFTINISPYKPELNAARISIISASGSQPPDTPDNVNDDNLKTKWSVSGDNQWLLFKLVGSYKISHLSLVFLTGQKYESYFDVYASTDNVLWEPILIKAASCNFSGDFQVFDFPEAKTSTEYLYIKLIGHGNSLNSLNTISELKIFGLFSGNPASVDSENKNVAIYPNPAQDFFKISIKEPTMRPDKVMLIDSSGRIVFEGMLESEIINVQIPSYIKSGFYIVELRSGKLILDAQKLVINRSAPN